MKQACDEMALDIARESNGGKPREFGVKLTGNHDMIKEALLKAESLGSIAGKCGVHRHTLSDYVHAMKDLEEAHNDGQEALIDRYEDALHFIALGDDPTSALNAIKFFLEKRAPHRGYGMRGERTPMSVFTRVWSGGEERAFSCVLGVPLTV